MNYFLSMCLVLGRTDRSQLTVVNADEAQGVIRPMRSSRFGKEIVITDHARDRSVERGLSEAALVDLVETGELRYVAGQHLFIFKQLPGRHDNLVCAAAVDGAALVVKTVMVNWTLRGES